jgi:3-(3-hydroxy-phenyl)propionate hydroxylase
VTVLERDRCPGATARAVALDDECLRVWQACGLEQVLDDDWDGGTPGQVICRYLSPRGYTFLKLTQRESDLGYPHAVAIHEPRITAKLRQAAERDPMIEYLGGCEVTGISQDDRQVVLRIAGPGAALERAGAWAVACDGASSRIRSLLGIGMRGAALPHPWLVVNLEDGEPLDHAQIRCDPRGPSVTMSLPHGLRRIECMLDADDAGAWLWEDESVRARLSAAWPGAATAVILTRSIVRFTARIAERWRCGRVFLAGDAAHTTPPFAAQGLATGLRDASNIAFKLAGVCQGWLPEGVLETYESERRPHQERMIRLALRLGALMMPRSPWQAACSQLAVLTAARLAAVRRHLQMRGRGIRPVYAHGFRRGGGKAGQCVPQPWVEVPGRGRVRFDSLLGLRMTWVAVGSGEHPGSAGGVAIAADDTVLVENRDFRDPGRVLQRSLGAGTIALIRPDRIIYSHLPSRRSRRSPGRSLSCHTPAAVHRQVSAGAGSSA